MRCYSAIEREAGREGDFTPKSGSDVEFQTLART
jgi:hypothetical protein